MQVNLLLHLVKIFQAQQESTMPKSMIKIYQELD